MALVNEAVQKERLIEPLTSIEGVPVTEVVRESLMSLAERRGVSQKDIERC